VGTMDDASAVGLWAVGAGQGVRCTHPDNAGKSLGE